MQIIVLGMHRSGTSVVARLLNMMGAYFAPEGEEMPPTAANPKGYWERKDIILLNEGIFNQLGATWSRLQKFDVDKIGEGLHQEFKRQASKIILSLDAHRPWMAKDPRFCMLFNLWKPLLEVPICVYVHRDPIQIAQSLKTRDGFSIHFGVSLWEKYILQSLKDSVGLPRLLVSFHELMQNPLGAVQSLYQGLLNLDVQGLRLPKEKEILAFIELQLIHEQGNSRLQHAYVNKQQLDLVEAFEKGSIFQVQELPTLSNGAAEILAEYEAHLLEIQTKITEHEQELSQKSAQQLAQHQQEILALTNNQQQLLATQTAQHQQQLVEQQGHFQQLFSEQTAHYQQQLSEQSAQYQQQMDSLRVEMARLQHFLDEHGQELHNKEQERLAYWQKWLAAEEHEVLQQTEIEDLQEEIAKLREQVEKLRTDSDFSQQEWENRLHEIQELLATRDQEVATLNHETIEQNKDIHKLVFWLASLQHDVNAMFNSQTWKSGQLVTNIVLKLLFRSPGLTAKDHIKRLLDDFTAWRINDFRIRENRPYLPPVNQVAASSTSLTATPAAKKKLRIAALIALHNGEPSASASIRLIQPFTHPAIKDFIDFQALTMLDLVFHAEVDIIIVQRHMIPHVEAAEKLISYCQNRGIRLIYETDDDLYNIFKKRDMYGSYAKDMVASLYKITQNADRVITSSPALQQQVSQINPRTICVPNALDERLWLEKQSGHFVQPIPAQLDDKIRILYMGTKTHTEDLQIVKKAYQKLKKTYGDRIILEIIGGIPDGTQVFGNVVDVNIVNDFTDNLDNYARFVNWLRQNNRWQFGIIPLVINDFNIKKTYIKFLDYSALGLASICSDIAPYREVVRSEENGLLVSNNTQSWYNAMKRLIDDVALRDKLAHQAFQDLTQRYILQQTIHEFVQAYGSVVDDKNISFIGQLAKDVTALQPDKQQDYLRWIKTYDTVAKKTLQQMYHEIQQWQSPPLITVIMPVYNIEEKWLRIAIESVRNQIYPNWELCIADDASTQPHISRILQEYSRQDERIKVEFRQVNGHISAASNSALTLATGDYVALLDHDDELPHHALYWVAKAIIAHPEVRLIYSDEDKINVLGERFGAYFKCDWNPDLFLSHNLITHLAVYKTQILREIGGFREGYEGAQDYDLALRVVERIAPQQILHIPRILYHWRAIESSTSGNPDAKPYAIKAAEKAISEFLQRRGITARVTESSIMMGMLRVQYPLPAQPPLVSIIIPTYNAIKLLRQCVESIRKKTDYPHYEIIIVNNRSDDPATLRYLQELQTHSIARVLDYPQPFNYAAINNAAVAQAQGEIIALLNNDIEVISKSWLTEMVSHAIRSEVGAVGARLWYPHHTLQHGGILLGVGGIAEHAHKNLPRGEGGYFGRAQVIQNFSAVTGACLVMRKALYHEVGGLNAEQLTVGFNDIDLCLKLLAKGLRNVWTPYAELYHHESATRGYEDTPEKVARLQKESAYMQQQWGNWLHNDPAYNPNLNNRSGDFTLAFPPRIDTYQSVLHTVQPPSPPTVREILPIIAHRQNGYNLLKGHGLEIGALHAPAQIPAICTVDYCDAQSKEEALQHFPELVGQDLVNVNYICDLDKQGLAPFKDGQYDFVIFNHVIEHIANPIRIIQELFRITRKGGLLVIAAPDKDYTFDKNRAITPFEHLWAEYQNNVTEITDEHYIDFIRGVHPQGLTLTATEMQAEIVRVKRRREHAHVWDSLAFKDFLHKTLKLLNLSATCLLENLGKNNHFEYFSIWKKT